MEIFGPNGGMICDRCGKELWGGPLDHLAEDREACERLAIVELARIVCFLRDSQTKWWGDELNELLKIELNSQSDLIQEGAQDEQGT